MTNIAKRFNRETIHHQLTVLHDDGLYKHLRFSQPDRSAMWFDLITWPSNLIVRGDYGDTYAFSRIEDMLAFFRTSAYLREPNLGYWAEKLTTDRDSVERYDDEIMRRSILDAINDETRHLTGLRAAVQEEVFDLLCGDESEDRRTVADFAYYRNDEDRYDYPRPDPDFTFEGSWEWKLHDYHWSFVWACHAILWGAEYYHLGHRPEPLPEPEPEPVDELDAGPETEDDGREYALVRGEYRPVTDVQLPEPEDGAS
jgi:hypothetical protein